ncbi:MAG: radical SAM protein [Deltaproteobacteria bacterium]|nr:radical SAM protein [Deltaproteobacteria bacterium]
MSEMTERMLERERIANRPKHWVRLTTACNNKCLFCLDMDTPRNVYLSEEEVKAELRRGRDELDATKVILSGGEASVHPLFPLFIRYALDIGYERVQTVTNGMRYGDRDFLKSVLDAGLGEITFSLHGHTAALHDHLVQTPGAFERLIRGLLRAKRDGRPIVNVDVVINKQNVPFIDKIVELCINMGVKEFDLLHVIPQAEAYRNRDEMFYDVREHLPRLQKVFRLNRLPGFYIWTNRFPVSYLEGMEDLIQDPHKMLDEVNGRRYHVRNYLDTGTPLECREPDRCKHCFIEPFCTTMERVVTTQNQEALELWWVGADPAVDPLTEPLPFGATWLGLHRATVGELPTTRAIYAEVDEAAPLPQRAADAPPLRLVAKTAAQLQAWLGEASLPAGVSLEIRLTQETAAWMLEHSERLVLHLDQLTLVQPTHETMSAAVAEDVRDPASFFAALGLRVRVAGLPACAAPGTLLVEPLRRLDRATFDAETGRLDWRELARHHVSREYRGKSVRCADCRLTARCEGLHINMIRDQGLKLCRPLVDGEWAEEAEAQLSLAQPRPRRRIEDGMTPQPPAPSLPGFAPPETPEEDPLRRHNGLKRSSFLRSGRAAAEVG